MKHNKKYSIIISFALLFAMLINSLGTLSVAASESTDKQITATTSASVKQGSGGTCYVDIDSLESLSTLSVTVYFDPQKIKVTDSNVYNSVSSELNDKTVTDSSIQFSYIFNGEGEAKKTRLFYFYYTVLSEAEVGDTYFDIVVNEAYDSGLNAVPVSGSRCSFDIAETVTNKTCSIYSSSAVSTSVGEEFQVAYRLSTYQIAAGSYVINYDPELFEVVEVINGNFFDGKIFHVNTELSGSIYVSFVGTSYGNYTNDLMTVKFKTIKNVAETSDVKLTVTEFNDLDLNPISCNGYTTKATIIFDEAYTEDAPSMSLQAVHNAENNQITLTIKLDKDSMLGAGDFILNFDPSYLAYNSSVKGFSPSFFNVNDKEISAGLLKFSILSLSDIVDEQTVLTVVFDILNTHDETTTAFNITGSGLTDSLTKAIMLNFVDASVTVPLKHTEAAAVEENKVEATCTVDGSYDSVVYCSICSVELTREKKVVGKLGHNYSAEWTVDVEPTCTTAGSKSRHCSRCDDKTDVTEIPEKGHAYGEWYQTKAPTCTETGTDEHKCSVCQHTETRTVNAEGHTNAEAVVENKVESDCTTDGSYDSVVYCSVCRAEITREKKVIEKLGHAHSEEWTVDVEPTCTTAGSKSHHCSRCDDKADVTEIPANGHSYGDWYQVKVPTCTETGTDEHKCSVCQHTETRTVNAEGHTNAEVVVENKVESDCTTDGSYDSVVYCSVCRAELTREKKVIEKLGHNYSTEWTVDVEPTCTTAGSKSRHCSRCDDKADVTEIPANGHTYGDWVPLDSNQHQHSCSCGESELGGHVFGANDVCTICNYRKYALGDLDCNGVVTEDDAVYLLLYTLFGDMFYPINDAPTDMDGSGIVDEDDAVYLLLHTLFGDVFYPLNPAEQP